VSDGPRFRFSCGPRCEKLSASDPTQRSVDGALSTGLLERESRASVRVSSRDIESGIAFVQGLARELGVESVIYLPGLDAGAWQIVQGPGREAAERVARAWLSAKGASTRPSPAPAAESDPPGLLTVPVSSPAFGALGVVVAARDPNRPWTERERALFRFALAAHTTGLDPRMIITAGPSTRIDDAFATGLRAAVANGELSLVYQPEVDLLTGRIAAVEALVRWQHPEFGELGPEWFISLAERSDLIYLVGGWVIDASIATLASWNAALPGLDVTMRINISPTQAIGDDIATPIAAALDRHGVPGRQVCIELTENVPFGDVQEVADALRRLKALGVSSAIDDLATGYSALSHLRSLPVDFVKVDRSLVSDIDTDRRAQTIVIALIGLAMNFGLGVIAEGVETEGEAAMLLQLGCTRAQGHHLGRPMAAEAVAELLRAQR